jgi:hypothetical protein
MIATLGDAPRRPVARRARARARVCAPAATDRASSAPCLGLAIAAGAAAWVALGGLASLLAG